MRFSLASDRTRAKLLYSTRHAVDPPLELNLEAALLEAYN